MKKLWNLAFQYNFRQKQVHRTIIPKEMLFSSLKKGQEKDLLRFYWEFLDDFTKLILIQIGMCIWLFIYESSPYTRIKEE